MIYKLDFYDINERKKITDISDIYGDVYQNFLDMNYLENKIKSGEYYDIKENSLDIEYIKDLKKTQLINLKEFPYSSYLVIDNTPKENIIIYGLIVKIENLHLLTHTKIFGDIDNKPDTFLQTLFSFHIKYLNMKPLLTTNLFNYRLLKIIDKLSKPRLYNLTAQPKLFGELKSKLYNYQLDNLNWMLERETKGIMIPISHLSLLKFPDGRYYNYTKSKFISDEEYECENMKYINNGIILDDVGIGKTLQMLSLIKINPDIRTVVLVPNHLIEHWNQEMNKHFKNKFTNLEIISFSDYLLITENKYDRIIIDEIHEIFYKKIDLSNLPKIKYRWGLTATPFTKGLDSIHGLLTYLLWDFSFPKYDIKNNTLIPVWNYLFRKNFRNNISDELVIPPVIQHNVFVKLNNQELSIYQTESMSCYNNIEQLRKICCDIMMMIDRSKGDKITLEEFIKRIIKKYKDNYQNELDIFNKIEKQLDEINEEIEELKRLNVSKMSPPYLELINNYNHFTHRKKEQYKKVESTKSQLDHISESLNEDEECPICYDKIGKDFSITKCRHSFCISCLEMCLKDKDSCPKCKTKLLSSDILIVNKNDNKNEIKLSSKISKLLEILNSNEEKFIIYTQFDYIIDKICDTLNSLGISTEILKNGSYKDFLEKKCRVLLASSESQMAGIDLSFISNMIIYEPYVVEYNYLEDYERQIIGRINRFGQMKTCNVYRLICKSTIEESIYIK